MAFAESTVKENETDIPWSSKGNTNLINWYERESYSTRPVMRVASSLSHTKDVKFRTHKKFFNCVIRPVPLMRESADEFMYRQTVLTDVEGKLADKISYNIRPPTMKMYVAIIFKASSYLKPFFCIVSSLPHILPA